MNNLNILPKGSFRYYDGITSKLKSLDVGGYIDLPRKKAQSSYNCANQIGMKVCTRKVNETTTRVYRIK